MTGIVTEASGSIGIMTGTGIGTGMGRADAVGTIGLASATVGVVVVAAAGGSLTNNSNRPAGRIMMTIGGGTSVHRGRMTRAGDQAGGIMAGADLGRMRRGASGGAAGGVKGMWGRLRGGRRRPRVRFRCPRGGGKRRDGMCTLLGMSSIRRCRRNKRVRVFFFPPSVV